MYFLKMRDNLGRAGIAVVLLGLFAGAGRSRSTAGRCRW
jgi:hypothetical protein